MSKYAKRNNDGEIVSVFRWPTVGAESITVEEESSFLQSLENKKKNRKPGFKKLTDLLVSKSIITKQEADNL